MIKLYRAGSIIFLLLSVIIFINGIISSALYFSGSAIILFFIGIRMFIDADRLEDAEETSKDIEDIKIKLYEIENILTQSTESKD